MTVWAVLLAGGDGRRFGTRKQFLDIAGTRAVDRVVLTAQRVVDGTVLVLPAGELWTGPPVDVVTAGGSTRAASVRAGLARVPESADVVVVHDAAHPLASTRLFAEVLAAVDAGADAAVCVVPMTEVVHVVRGRCVLDVLPKAGQVLAQSPAAFRAGVLRAAHAGSPEATEDVALVVALGARVATVDGDPRNVHVTTEPERLVAERLAGLLPWPPDRTRSDSAYARPDDPGASASS